MFRSQSFDCLESALNETFERIRYGIALAPFPGMVGFGRRWMICSLSFMFAALLSGCGGEFPSYGLDGTHVGNTGYGGTQVGNTGVTTFVFLADGSVNCAYKGPGVSPGLVLQGRADSNSSWVFMGQSPAGEDLLTISLDLFQNFTEFKCSLFEGSSEVDEPVSIVSQMGQREAYNSCQRADLNRDTFVTQADVGLMWFVLKNSIGHVDAKFDVDANGEMNKLDLAMVQDCSRFMPQPGESIAFGGVQP